MIVFNTEDPRESDASIAAYNEAALQSGQIMMQPPSSPLSHNMQLITPPHTPSSHDTSQSPTLLAGMEHRVNSLEGRVQTMDGKIDQLLAMMQAQAPAQPPARRQRIG